MTEVNPNDIVESDAAATLMRAAGLRVEPKRLDVLARLIDAARTAVTHLDRAAARTPLEQALAEFDPAWPEGGTGS